jgi:diguanylate cyclase (GGDEF)-like protein/PAS domain S-box-containing protein
MNVDFKSLLANIRDGVYFTDKDRTIIYWNKAAERITGYSAEEVIGRRCRDNILIHVDDQGHNLCKGKCPLAQTIKDHESREGHVFLHHKDGHRVPVNIRVAPLIDDQGRIIGAAEFFSDTNLQETMQQRIEELQNLAMLDPLTQLPNRHHIEPELESRFHEMKRLGLTFGLLFIDIDHFKVFNDEYGHDIGDKVLQTVANTLKRALRPFDMVGRWGGEEFIGIIRNTDKARLLKIANRMRHLIGNSTVRHCDAILRVTVSMGATMALGSDTKESLVKRVDQLMYNSKQKGRNRVTIG